ncbi:MAG: 2Fe-2S iron-sulfur cluster-binding protein [Chloroflexota bacterium]
MTTHTLTILTHGETHTLTVPHGANLRRTLLENGFSPYAPLMKRVNCGGRGICATCGVWIETNEPPPDHWHDKLAAAYGYPRLSCQITVTDDITIHILDDKRIWGDRDPSRKFDNRIT